MKQKPKIGPVSMLITKILKPAKKISSNIVENNLTEFKKYLDNPDSEIRQYLGENGIIYSYDVNFSVYSHDADGNLINSDNEIDSDSSPMGSSNGQTGILSRLNGASALGGGSSSGASNFSELMVGADGQIISPVITDSYDVLYGTWPEEYNEIVLVLNETNGISAGTLYQLGLITEEQYKSAVQKIENGERCRGNPIFL